MHHPIYFHIFIIKLYYQTTHAFLLFFSSILRTPSKSFTICHILLWFGTRAPSQYPTRRLFVRSREVSKPRDWYFKLSYRFEIWQAHRQQCCRSACQISERSDNSKCKSRGFETLRDLTKRRLIAPPCGAFDLGLAVSVPLPIVMGIFVLLWFQSRLT